MAKQKFRHWEPRITLTESQKKAGQMMTDAEYVRWMSRIVDLYAAKDRKLTGRQLYYQMVSGNFEGCGKQLVPNTEKSYKKVLDILANARYAGLIDWDAIEDRGREALSWRCYDGPYGAISNARWGYRLDRWMGQPNYVELWVEKAALAGVLRPIASRFFATLMVNKGYSSASAMYDAFRRFRQQGHRGNRTILYLGDHDPSGEDMVRDIRERLNEFGVTLEVVKIALTMDQVEEYNPPPNPAKTTDSRAAKYIEEHGDSSWEVDALRPETLEELIVSAFKKRIDESIIEKVKRQEAIDVAYIEKAANRARKDTRRMKRFDGDPDFEFEDDAPELSDDEDEADEE